MKAFLIICVLFVSLFCVFGLHSQDNTPQTKNYRNCWWTFTVGDLSCGGGAGSCAQSGCQGKDNSLTDVRIGKN